MASITDRLWNLLPHPPPSQQADRQYGAIPYAMVDGQAIFLLITTRRTGRWIFPKGAAVEGLAGWELAAREAREEAGVVGTIDRTCIGWYRDRKVRGLRRVHIDVYMFPLRVEQQWETWDESGQRHRHWATYPEARRLLTNPRLIAMMATIDRGARAEPSYSPVANASSR